jgi:hypothetical protein
LPTNGYIRQRLTDKANIIGITIVLNLIGLQYITKKFSVEVHEEYSNFNSSSVAMLKLRVYGDKNRAVVNSVIVEILPGRFPAHFQILPVAK